jgi:hypothetical protein
MATDCTTVQLGPATTLVVGERVDRTVVRINQTASTTINDNCTISVLKTTDLRPKTSIQAMLTSVSATEETRVTVIGGIRETVIGGGGGGPCFGPTNVSLSYLPDGRLDQAVQDSNTATMGYTGDLLTTVTHSDGCLYTLTYSATNTLISVVKS